MRGEVHTDTISRRRPRLRWQFRRQRCAQERLAGSHLEILEAVFFECFVFSFANTVCEFDNAHHACSRRRSQSFHGIFGGGHHSWELSFRKGFVLYPANQFRQWWTFLMAFPILYIGIIMPYTLCFLEVFELCELRTGFMSLRDVESTQAGNATGGLSND